MAITENQRSAAPGSIVRELFQTGIYKRTQGKVARSLTGLTIAVLFAIAAYRIGQFVSTDSASIWTLWVPTGIAVVGAWLAFRLVNWPTFADFLISVESEMAKVSWPTRVELVRSVAVVIVSLLLLVTFLFLSDLFWLWLLKLIGVAK